MPYALILKERLLHLFPIATIRGSWPAAVMDDKLSKTELVTKVVTSIGEPELLEFVCQHFSETRQHIHLFALAPRTLSDLPSGARYLGDETAFRTKNSSKRREAFFLLKVKHDVILIDPLENLSLDFLWPARVILESGRAELRLTTLAKNIGDYVPEERRYTRHRVSLTEESLVANFTTSLAKYFKTKPLDLNTGVKSLWRDGLIDSAAVRWKRSYSTSAESMDPREMLRLRYPALFDDIMKAPLFKTEFRFMQDAQDYVDVFTADPTRGILTFPRFSEASAGTGLDNVVRAILGKN